MAHRLTRQGVVVGRMETNSTVDFLGNHLAHTYGVKWDPNGSRSYEPLTLNGDGYRYPKGCFIYTNVGIAYDLTVPSLTNWLGFVTNYPTLQDVWDLDSSGRAAGAATVYMQPDDVNHDGHIDYFEMPTAPLEYHQFDATGTLQWLNMTERGVGAGYANTAITRIDYNALLTSAAQFGTGNTWTWLGPVTMPRTDASTFSIALLANDSGLVAGYGSAFTGDPAVDVFTPTHAFRWTAADNEFTFASPTVHDLDVLPGGAHSFPRAMNQLGELVGYSDFDVMDTGGLTFNPINSHAVFWGLTNQTPEYLTNLPPSALAPYGFGDAYAINDNNQIVGDSMAVDGRFVAVMWQLNHNTNSAPPTNSVSSTNNAPFREITDLNDRLTDTNWYVFNAVGINNDGVILAHAFNAAQEKHAVLLIPMAMAVDNNRDGQITFDAADQTSADKPYRFWVNDSQQRGDEVFVAEDQIPGQSFFNANCSLIHVNGRSDVVNFFPVALRLGSVLHLFSPTNGFEYRLLQDDAAPPLQGNSPIKFVYTGLTQANAFDYLTNTVSTGYGANFDETAAAADTIQVLNTPGTMLDTNWLAQVQNNGGNGVILVEGCAATAKPLWLEIRRNGKLLGETPLYLSIDGVEKMFRHLNLCAYGNGTVDPNNPSRYDAPNEPETKDKNFVFLHGYNVNQQEARGVLSEVFKRMYWSGSKAKFYGVTWNGAVTKNLTSYLPLEWQFTPNYHTNVVNALLTAPHFADFLGNLSGETVVAAHSLGNMVVLSALNDCTNVNFKVNTYFMINAAVAMEAIQSMPHDPAMVHSTWQNYSNRLFASDWWQLFPAGDGRRKLTWNNRLANFRNTDIYNFYSSGEEVLRQDDDDPPAYVLNGGITEYVNKLKNAGPFGSYAWVWQEKGKGATAHDWFIGSTHGGWKFSYFWRDEHGTILSPESMNDIANSRLQEQPFFSVGSSANGPPDEDLLGDDGSAYAQANRNRILSDAIPALTLPVGANPVLGSGIVTLNLNMELLENSWPLDRINTTEFNNWHHSDFVYVAYPFTYKLFNEIVTDGKLKLP